MYVEIKKILLMIFIASCILGVSLITSYRSMLITNDIEEIKKEHNNFVNEIQKEVLDCQKFHLFTSGQYANIEAMLIKLNKNLENIDEMISDSGIVESFGFLEKAFKIIERGSPDEIKREIEKVRIKMKKEK